MPSRYEQLSYWVIDNRWTKGAELGVFDGRTLLYLLDHCPKLHMIGVDVWTDGIVEGPTKSGERCACGYCQETRDSRRLTPLEDHERRVVSAALKTGRATILKMPTVAAAHQIFSSTLDFVFIDADHSTEGVSADITNWRSKLRRGGRLIGHDYNMKSVRDAVEGLLGDYTIHTEDDHLWWVEP